MLKVRVGLGLAGVVGLALLTLGFSGGVGLAQESASCPLLLDTVIGVVSQACGDLAPGEVCYGSAPSNLDASSLAGGDAPFAEAGDIVALADVVSLATGAPNLDEETWGVAVLSAAVDLPAEAEHALSMVLFGDAELTNLVDPNTEAAPTVTFQNGAGYPVNLRQGGGTNFPVGGTLEENVPVVADGQNAGGDWYRIQTDPGLLWVYRDLVTIVEGDVGTLQVLEANDILPAYSEPMQAFNLVTAAGEPVCGAASAGLLLQLSGEDTAHLQVNGADLAFSTATLLVQNAGEESMDILVLDGAVSLSANGIGISADTGTRVELLFDGMTNPVVHQAYRFGAVEGVPLDLLPSDVVCMAGLPAAGDEVTLYTGPGDAYGVLTGMDPDLHYQVDGQLVDDEDNAWYRLNVAGYARAWVQQAEVHTVGLCTDVAEVAAPPVTAGPSGGAAGSGLVPAGQSVWQSDPGLDNLNGTCTGPAIALCAHLVAIQPNADGSLSWRGQEPVPYTIYPAGENTYSYNGRNNLGNGNIQITLSFTSDSTWSMTMTQVYDNDPACNHTFYYTANRSW